MRGHFAKSIRCPLYPQKRPFGGSNGINGWAEPIGSNIFSSGEALGLVHIDHSLVKLMKRPSKPDRRRFLLNSGILAAAWELSRADSALTQELAPTPSCHDGDEPTVSETEGPFFKPRSPERSDLHEPGARGH